MRARSRWATASASRLPASAPGVQILPVRVMNARGAGSDRAIARGVRYAADKGAQVINLSLGASLTIDADTAGAVSSGVSAAGGDVPPSVADGVDVCRDALGAALGKVKEQVSAQAQQQIRDSTGLPLPSTPMACDIWSAGIPRRPRYSAPISAAISSSQVW